MSVFKQIKPVNSFMVIETPVYALVSFRPLLAIACNYNPALGMCSFYFVTLD